MRHPLNTRSQTRCWTSSTWSSTLRWAGAATCWASPEDSRGDGGRLRPLEEEGGGIDTFGFNAGETGSIDTFGFNAGETGVDTFGSNAGETGSIDTFGSNAGETGSIDTFGSNAKAGAEPASVPADLSSVMPGELVSTESSVSMRGVGIRGDSPVLGRRCLEGATEVSEPSVAKTGVSNTGDSRVLGMRGFEPLVERERHASAWGNLDFGSSDAPLWVVVVGVADVVGVAEATPMMPSCTAPASNPEDIISVACPETPAASARS